MVKINIKAMATSLREKKEEYKSIQRAYSKTYFKGEFNSRTWFKQPEKYLQIKPTLNKMVDTQYQLQTMKEDFRTQHIVNSMCKGRNISQIESKTRGAEDYRIIRERCYRNAASILEDMGKEWIN